MGGRGYVIVETTADAGVEARGGSLEELFENAARGLFELLRGEPPPAGPPGVGPPRGDVPGTFEAELRVEPAGRSTEGEGGDPGALLVAFLNECIFALESRRALPLAVRVGEAGPGGVRATLFFEGCPEAADAVGLEVKAATYHDLRVEERASGWEARVIFDL